MVEVDVRVFAKRDLPASAPCTLECKISTNARSKEAITLRLDFITDALLLMMCCVYLS